MTAYRDRFGNWCTRLVAPPGRMRLSADALVQDAGVPEPAMPDACQHEVQDLPDETLVFLLGSRYCETDRLSELAWSLFANTPPGWPRVQAICDFVHDHLAFGYQYASAPSPRCRPTTTATACAATLPTWRSPSAAA